MVPKTLIKTIKINQFILIIKPFMDADLKVFQ